MSAIAASFYRAAWGDLPAAPGAAASASQYDEQLDEVISAAVRRGECPAGWPKFAPDEYEAQLRTKARMCRRIFPELQGDGRGSCELEVLASPKVHHRMRARVGVVGTESPATVAFASAFEEGGGGGGGSGGGGAGCSGSGEILDTLPHIACEAIAVALPLLLESLRRHSVLRSHLTCLNLLSVRDGVAVGADGTPRPRSLVVSLIYRAPVPDEGAWVAAATEEARRITGGGTDGEGSGGGRGGSSGGDSGDGGSGVSFICQARGQRLAAGGGDCSVLETYRLRDGRRLTYRHVFGHFSNPNAFACEHTLDFLSAAVTDGLPAAERRGVDLLELYCGNGNHTVALAPLFRRALAVEIDPSLVEAAEGNLARNGVTNAAVLRSPSAAFCGAVLRKGAWTDRASGHAFAFGAVLVDPPRAGLDDATRRLVANSRHFRHVLYVSCNPFVSLRRDLSAFQAAGLELRRFALIDHFPYTPHAECAVYLVRPAGDGDR